MSDTATGRGRATRERLLAAAVELVGELGWSGVTTRLVAERAGVNPGLVHYHFSSVAELLSQACGGYVRRLLDETTAALTAHDDIETGMHWLLDELSRYSGHHSASLPLVEAFLAAGRDPGLRTELAAVLADFRGQVAEWLCAHGKHHQAEPIAALLGAALDGLALHGSVDPDFDIRSVAGPLCQLMTED
ncbi:TetR/AcrR family transcriptional regulator [Sciscionella sediminilitoris]|uniref:TetR/AcrR family transcriptional regulator n=1 Tax=Sciscionella sediminilitoris TaxID=1445613 RepID=UPI0004DF6F51|nr:TetR/AcrR family transcriptional regulator [Sciscionella sp. SE31]